MNGFFTDNQTKQKAYDRYYNAMAKRDFVQGAKLKAMIQEQALDEASSDSLANLFQQVMGKNREYDYDQITRKLMKKAPKVMKGKQQSSIDSPKETKSKTAKKFKYVPQTTDTDVIMATPSPGKSSKNFLNDGSTQTTPVETASQSIQVAPRRASKQSQASTRTSNQNTQTDSEADLEEKAPIPQTPARAQASTKAASPGLSPQDITKYKPLLDSGRKAVRYLMKDEGIDATFESPKYLDALLTEKPKARALTLSQVMDKLDKKRKLDDLKATITEMVDNFDDDTGRDSKKARNIKVVINAFFSKEQKVVELNEDEKKVATDAIVEIVESAKKAREKKRVREATPASKTPTDQREKKKSSANQSMYPAVKEIMLNPKRKRESTPAGKTPSDQRAPKVVVHAETPSPAQLYATPTKQLEDMKQKKSPSVQRNLIDDFDDVDDFDRSIDKAINFQKKIQEYVLMSNKFTKSVPFYKEFKAQFGKDLNEIIANGLKTPGNEPYFYFNKMFPPPNKDRDLKRYKKSVEKKLRDIIYMG
ncbi:TPA: hypothetical protein N0F65_012916 [Lagenidium giganteum]|uniref:Uncharacterized protein n=1 Tax=Lagenidium giganteum TaxID=4803 RepID=A0AAV2YV09_9STRA|nr:TPA: hypothetical protein N0F65_012916 [Lagenidium giganteum]